MMLDQLIGKSCQLFTATLNHCHTSVSHNNSPTSSMAERVPFFRVSLQGKCCILLPFTFSLYYSYKSFHAKWKDVSISNLPLKAIALNGGFKTHYLTPFSICMRLQSFYNSWWNFLREWDAVYFIRLIFFLTKHCTILIQLWLNFETLSFSLVEEDVFWCALLPGKWGIKLLKIVSHRV